MIVKQQCYNRLLEGPVHPAAAELEREGHVMLRGVLGPDRIEALRAEVLQIFEDVPPDRRKNCSDPVRAEIFRYELFNRGALCQALLAEPQILAVIEPLLGGDCHVVGNTAWRNPADPSHAPRGQEWHVDGGPHVVRPAGVPWPDAIPYPVFVIAAQVYLEPCRLADGPTTVLPGSHRSGGLPECETRWDFDLTYEGRAAVPHVAEPGDVGFVVSDAWHRRLPPQPEGTGRLFVQINYGRREIAPRILTPERLSPATPEARSRAVTERQRQLIGLHDQGFYDA